MSRSQKPVSNTTNKLTLSSILLPIYTWWQLPYYYAGCKLYDILAGKENMESAYWMGKGKTLEVFPMLRKEGLVGGVVYYDGLFRSIPYVGSSKTLIIWDYDV